MTKVRRRDFEQRLREFIDAVEYITDRTLLLWAPGAEDAAAKLVKAVARLRKRTALARSANE
jgi:hypothetical protein